MSTLCILATHSPRIIHQDRIEEPFQGLYEGMKACGEEVQRFKPDVFVVLTTHWFTTFNIYANATPIQAGIYTAPEAPETINRMVYKLKGDTELAHQIVENGLQDGLPCKIANDETMLVDYGTLVPVQYFDQESKIPVVSLSVSLNSSVEEYIKLGNSLAKTFEKSGKKVAFVGSGSLAHYHSRKPEDWPTEEEQKLDRELLGYLETGRFNQLRDRLDKIAKAVRMEGFGYHVAALLGVLEGLKHEEHESRLLVYGPSSGTGNACMTFTPTK
ncbi:AmmeMemoRadiSam system protein B [Niallia oryzisoli]|uniref:AmmeMemoRadiSam system protein B n=1 Tax=Niallia oryzisoli TaxID=1737571 RepID=UPI0037355867